MPLPSALTDSTIEQGNSDIIIKLPKALQAAQKNVDMVVISGDEMTIGRYAKIGHRWKCPTSRAVTLL
jgi:hypothetical protein